ncbi:hypothetical protein ACYX7E_02890 [Luteimonas sp. RIT-PG2_3]
MRIALILIIALLLSGCRVSPPSHEELTAELHANRAEYEELKTMLLQDRLVTVASYGTEFAKKPYMWSGASEIGLPTARAQLYQRIMQDADIQRIDRNEDGEVLISMATWGTANRGWRVSSVWRETPPSHLLPSLDAFRKTSKEWETAYAPASDNWYFRIVW